MAIEIGSLVVRGSFGPARSEPEDMGEIVDERLSAFRREMLDELREALSDAQQRSRER
jgi:hypothetical protein